jgi:hypothetical protein
VIGAGSILERALGATFHFGSPTFSKIPNLFLFCRAIDGHLVAKRKSMLNTLHKFLFLFVACLLLAISGRAQRILDTRDVSAAGTTASHDFSETVIPLTDLKPALRFHTRFGVPGLVITADFGTGFCLDPDCRFIGTNYHVAAISKPGKIKGDKIVARYCATGPNDEDAAYDEMVGVENLRFTRGRDLAIYEVREPLRHHHGMAFTLDEPEPGDIVDIYTYPKEGASPFRKLLRFTGRFQGAADDGLLAFEYEPSNGKKVRPGASGGIVVDRETERIVGVLNSIVAETNKPTAVAVPTKALADFVGRVNRPLAQKLFPSYSYESSVSDDDNLKCEPPDTDRLERAAEEPPE